MQLPYTEMQLHFDLKGPFKKNDKCGVLLPIWEPDERAWTYLDPGGISGKFSQQQTLLFLALDLPGNG